jgi:hypothetical protein
MVKTHQMVKLLQHPLHKIPQKLQLLPLVHLLLLLMLLHLLLLHLLLLHLPLLNLLLLLLFMRRRKI